MLTVTAYIQIPETELTESFVRASGPGGQNVNKVATAVQLRFDAAHSASLPEPVRARLIKFAGRRMTKEGVLVITANRYRTQEANKEDAFNKLVTLIREAAQPPRQRRATNPSRASVERRLQHKRQHARKKSERRSLNLDE